MDDATVEAAPAYDDAPPFTDTDRERALAAADALRAGADVGPDDLVALSPDEAGRLVADLAAAGSLDALAVVVGSTPPHRYPLVALLTAAASVPVDDGHRGALRPRGGVGDTAPPARGARRGRRRSRAPRGARRGRRGPYRAGGRPAVPLVGRARDDDGRAARQRRRRRPWRRRLPRRRDDPQVLRPPRRRRHRAPRRGGGRPAFRGHPRPPVPQGRRPGRQLAAGPAGRRDRRARRRPAPRPDVHRGHRQPARPDHRHRPGALPGGDDDVHREVRRGAGTRAPARAPDVARRPGRRGRLAHDRRRRDTRRGRRGDGAGTTRRHPARPRPAAGRAAAGPGRLGLPRRRRQHVLRLDGVRRRPGRARPRPAEHQHPRRRHRRVRDRDPPVDPVLRRPGQGLPRPGRARPADRPGDPARACRRPCAPSSRLRVGPALLPCCCSPRS